MDSNLLKVKRYSDYIPFVLLTLYMIYRYYSNYLSDQVSLDGWLIKGNFIPLITTPAYFFARYKQIGMYAKIRNLSVIRIGNDGYEWKLLKRGILNAIIYTILTYIMIIAIFYFCVNNLIMLLIYSMINLVLFVIYECLYVYIVMKVKNSALVLIPFFLTLCIHYLIVLPNIHYGGL